MNMASRMESNGVVGKVQVCLTIITNLFTFHDPLGPAIYQVHSTGVGVRV